MGERRSPLRTADRTCRGGAALALFRRKLGAGVEDDLVREHRAGDLDELCDGGGVVVPLHRRAIAEALESREERGIVGRLADVVVQRIRFRAADRLDHFEERPLDRVGVAGLGADDGGDGHHGVVPYADTPMNSPTTAASARCSGASSWVMRPFWISSTRCDRARMKSRFCSTSRTVRPERSRNAVRRSTISSMIEGWIP